MEIKTPIIPTAQTFAKVDRLHELNFEAICIFVAIGFFLDQDTYWKDEVALSTASNHKIDSDGKLRDSNPWFKWHYTPREITFNQALEDFSVLFETIISEQTQGKKVILPLSGGLDSRTQAAALKHLNANVFSYSYRFENGYPETKIAKQIAEACNFEFKKFEIYRGYLWNSIDDLAELNQCYSDFTTPRQMAIHNEFESMGDIFSLGHWGDVLFDSFNLPELSDEAQVDVLIKKLLKKGGLDLATKLWKSWNLSGSFEIYFESRIKSLLEQIEIKNINAKLRAFKSLYWAPRWTSVNLSIFSSKKPITLPYYDKRMCEFICTVPEEYLKNRQLQINYIKNYAPELAKISWQDQRPFNLNNFQLNRAPYNLPYRITNKIGRMLKNVSGRNYVQRNWELQFNGDDNKLQLQHHLLNSGLENLIPKSLITTYCDAFINNNSLQNAHAMNMLLVLSQFNKIQRHA